MYITLDLDPGLLAFAIIATAVVLVTAIIYKARKK